MATLDYVILGIAAFTLVLYVIMSAVKSGARAFVGLLIFLLTVASAGVVIYAISAENTAVQGLFAENALYKWIALGVVCAYALFVMLAFGGISAKKVYGADVLRCVIMLLLGAGVIVLSFLVKALAGFLIYGIIAAGAALVMLILESAIVGARRKKAKTAKKAAEAEVVEEAPVEEAVEEAPVEEAAPVEETVEEEAPVEESAPVEIIIEDNEPVADEADFEG
jgi:hypothetical protein